MERTLGETDQGEVIKHLSSFDGAEQPFLFLDANAAPVFLSARAARLLEMRSRSELANYAALLTPLAELCRRPAAPAAVTELRGQHAALGASELDLITTTGRGFKALAFARPFSIPSLENAWLVSFHDLSLLEPFFRSIEQSRKNRAMILLASSHVGRNLLFDYQGKDLSANYDGLERDFFKNVTSAPDDWMQADLLSTLSAAVDIVDPLIVSSTKITVEARTSGLLRISKPNFLRIVCHLLLEAADFIGPFGAITLKASLTTAGKAEVSLLSNRTANVPLEAGPLELYLYRRYMPVHYNISVTAEGENEGAFKGVYFGVGSEVSAESLSENVSIAANIAKKCGVAMQIKRPKNEMLVLSAGFDLASERL